jgi:two-component system, sensor histidine kinase and response regulator
MDGYRATPDQNAAAAINEPGLVTKHVSMFIPPIPGLDIELETLRDSLVHMIVHDMRSPLSVVLGNLELAKMQPLSKQADDCIGRALSSTGTLLSMVSTLLDLSNMEAGQMTLEFSAVDMRDLVSQTIRMVEPLKDQRRLTITSPEEIEPFEGDIDLIRRVIQNLIGNAIKFTDKEKGFITVCIENATEDKVRVSVVDNGRGIPLEYREKVFDKFCSFDPEGRMFLNVNTPEDLRNLPSN